MRRSYWQFVLVSRLKILIYNPGNLLMTWGHYAHINVRKAEDYALIKIFYWVYWVKENTKTHTCLIYEFNFLKFMPASRHHKCAKNLKNLPLWNPTSMHCDKMVIKSFFFAGASLQYSYLVNMRILKISCLMTSWIQWSFRSLKTNYEDNFMFCIFARTHNLVGLCVLPLPWKWMK